MRLFALTAVASIIATVAGFLTYELIALLMSAAALLVALLALVRTTGQASDIRRLTDMQTGRVDALDDRRED